MKKILITALLLIASSLISMGQLVETNPAIPTMGQEIIIYYHTDRETGELNDFTGDIYAHTGVTIEGIGRWQKVIESWGNNTTQPKLEYLGNFIYRLVITPDIESFYPDLTGTEKITELCFVFRDATAELQSADMFIPVFEPGLNVTFVTPGEQSIVVPLNEPINIKASATLSDSIELFIDDTRVHKVSGIQDIELAHTADTYGSHWVKAVAWDYPDYAADSFYYFVKKDPVIEVLPGGLLDGINLLSESEVTLVLHAPGKSDAFVLGDFNNWTTSDEGYMKQTPDGERFWLELTGLSAGVEYRFQYMVDGSIRIADPYAELLLDPWNDQYISEQVFPDLAEYPIGKAEGMVALFETAPVEYSWDNTNFTPPAKTDLVIYELLVRDFVATHDIKTLIDTLGYLDRLGVNAIELMPVNEFDGNSSWGYNPNFYFAVDKYYGRKNDLKEFIDSCHNRGMAVIMDMVLNHSWGQSPMVQLYYDRASYQVTSDNPWYNVIAKHDFNVGYDFNHQSPSTQAFSKRVMEFWIEEFNIDGYRFDMSKGFTQVNTLGNIGAWGAYDASRVALWKMYADHMWSFDPDFYIILEHFADNTEEKELANYGMMLWGNMSGPYSEASMGYSSDISWSSYKNRGWDDPHAIVYMESHDEERMQYRNSKFGASSGSYNVKSLYTGLERDILAAALHFTIPGPKMLWQFEEMGYDYSIDYNGRTGEKPIRWDYYLDLHRRRVYDGFAALIKLRTEEPAFGSTDFTITQYEKKKSININHSDMDVLVAGNFELVTSSVSVEFSKTGWWYEFFGGDSLNVTNTAATLNMAPGAYMIYTTKRLQRPDIALAINDILYTRANGDWVDIYPNPADDYINISPDETARNSAYRLDFIDMSGRTVKVINLEAYQLNSQVDISTLERGTYMLRISGGGRIGVKKLIIR